MILFIDNETAGVEFAAGVYRYAEQGARILLTAAQWSHGPCDHGELSVHEWCPEWARQLQYIVNQAERVVIHNDEFDCTVLHTNGVIIPPGKRYCTMRQARRHGLPGGLDKLCQIFKIPEDSAKRTSEGRQLLKVFCQTNKDGSWNTKETHPHEWARFKVYAGSDVSSMRELYYRMPKWNDEVERDITLLDAVVNERGFQVDTEFAWWAVQLLADEKGRHDASMAAETDNAVQRGTQRDRLLKYLLNTHGVELPDLTAATLERRLKDPDLPDCVKNLLAIRLESAKVSTAKYTTLLRGVCRDGRLRGVKVYCGAARTGRWAAQRFQSDNMVRPTLPPEEVLRGIRHIKTNTVSICGQESLTRYASEGLRGTVVAVPGHRLIVADLTNIEGRLTAWLAGEAWKLDAFRAYDTGTGPDLYKLAVSRAFALQLDAVSVFYRQIGKVMELFLGYGGGVGAFVTGAATYKIELEAMAVTAWPTIPRGLQLDAQRAYSRAVLEEELLTQALTEAVWTTCWALSRLWRRQHPKTAQLWRDVEHAAKLTAVDGRTREVEKLEFSKVDNWLRMRLPSGRYLCYPSPKIKGGQLHFWGVDPYKKIWRYLDTWGGTLVENAAQATARDVLVDGMLTAHEAGGRIVLHIHDEIILEQPEKDGWSVEQLVECMTREYAWNRGLPLAAKGFETDRYYKEA